MADVSLGVPVDSIQWLRDSFPEKEIVFEADFSVPDLWSGLDAICTEFRRIGASLHSLRCSAPGTVFCIAVDGGQDLRHFARNLADRDDMRLVRWATRLNI